MCQAGYDHNAIKLSPLWPTLKLIGIQRTPADDYGPETALELRDCPCGSTLAKLLKP